MAVKLKYCTATTIIMEVGAFVVFDMLFVNR